MILSGGDDYLVKPFSIDELIARVESVLRRYHKGIEIIHVLNIEVDTKKRCVIQNGKKIDITNMEYELLLFLIRNNNLRTYLRYIFRTR